MNRLSKLFMSGMLAVSLAVCSGTKSVSGEYTCTAKGMSDVTVTLTLKDSIITNINAEGPW